MIIPVLGFFMEPWQIYASIGLALIIIEALNPALVFLPIGVGFFLTAAFAPFIEGWNMQLVVLAVNCTLVFFAFKKWVAPRFKGDGGKTNVGAMIGKTAIVTEDINPANDTGYVKLYGDRWKAVSANGENFAVGTKVTIKNLDGNKVIVE